MSLSEKITEAAAKVRNEQRNATTDALNSLLHRVVKESAEEFIGPIHIQGSWPGDVSFVARIEDHYFALHPRKVNQLMYVAKNEDVYQYVGPFNLLSEVEALIEGAKRGNSWSLPKQDPQLWNRQAVGVTDGPLQPTLWQHIQDVGKKTVTRLRPTIDEIC